MKVKKKKNEKKKRHLNAKNLILASVHSHINIHTDHSQSDDRIGSEMISQKMTCGISSCSRNKGVTSYLNTPKESSQVRTTPQTQTHTNLERYDKARQT